MARRASLGKENASPQSIHVANWVVGSADNQGVPFTIIDKVNAKGQLQRAAPALLGLVRGDDSLPGIGQCNLSSIRLGERTTPAGCFVASRDWDVNGRKMLWVDYDIAILFHQVIKGAPTERPTKRLDSASPDDNRNSCGCINVPLKFYKSLVSPACTDIGEIACILPETRPARKYSVPVTSKNCRQWLQKPC